jgi:hypothetical protein
MKNEAKGRATRPFAECTEGFITQPLTCYDMDGQMCQAYIQTPTGGQYGVNVACGSVPCCGVLYTTCWGTNPCQPAVLRNLESREQLTKLAAVSEVLIADCKGNYTLFHSTDDYTARPKWVGLRDSLER